MALWRIEKIDHKKFPYRLTIVEGKKATLALLVQDKWPGQKGNIFCLRDLEQELIGEVVEEVEITSLQRFGKKLSIALDRAQKKRCEFLFLEKAYKNKEGTYEQIFFRTQAAIKQHRSKAKSNLRGQGETLDIVIDSNERYPWRFSSHTISRKNLTTGDYALVLKDEIAAVVERKTFDNLLGDIGQLQILHQQLAELAQYPHSALLIEAQYGDFLDSNKMKHWPVAYVGRVLSELSVLHPSLSIIYAGSRGDANHWALKFFEGVALKAQDKTVAPIAETLSKARTKLTEPQWLQIKNVVRHEMPERFTTQDVTYQIKNLNADQVRRQLIKLKEEGVLDREGHGKSSFWVKHNDY